MFVTATKIGENTTNILNYFFQNKFALCHIKPNIYKSKTKFASHKQYLLSLLHSRNSKKTDVYYTFFTVSEKKQLTNL